MKDGFVDAGGIKTHYFEEGDGAPLILVHGGGAGADSWGNWRQSVPLLARGRRVIAVDMVGFGKTDKPNPAQFEYSQPARNRHLTAFIEAMKLKKVSLIGNSMGGATSLGVCMNRPELVDKLVLMGSAGLNTEINESIRVILGFTPSRENMTKLIQVLTGPDFKVDPEMVEYRFNLTQQPGMMEAYGATMKWVGQQGGLFYQESEIAKVKHKTLIVGGKEDKIVPPPVALKFFELLENSWIHLIPHTGHWAMMERPAEFTQVTSWFLDNC
jgi:2-hydroxy-6-oxo-6-(2'-aminophenyl)hexa-2,4-dienoate hydrolase